MQSKYLLRSNDIMPELPEVETVCRALSSVMVGQTVSELIINRPNLRFPLPERFANRLEGKKIQKLERRAKYLSFTFDSGLRLLSHLGMSGTYRILEGEDVDEIALIKHDHVVFVLSSGVVIAYNDPRRFGYMVLCEADEYESHPLVKEIGVEPFSEVLTFEYLEASFKGKKTPIKNALLDQKIIAGLGNIYVSEILFGAHIHPKRMAGSLNRNEIRALIPETRNVLERAIAAGGSTLKDHRLPDGELGYFSHEFMVYGRASEACLKPECGGEIEKIVQGGRSSFYCSRCQK